MVLMPGGHYAEADMAAGVGWWWWRLAGLLLCALSARCAASCDGCAPGPPVLLVPGDLGNQLEARLSKPSVVHYMCSKKTDYYFTLWLNLELLLPLVIDCWMDSIRLVYNTTTRTTAAPEGVDVRVPGFGQTYPLEFLDPSKRSVDGDPGIVCGPGDGAVGMEGALQCRRWVGLRRQAVCLVELPGGEHVAMLSGITTVSCIGRLLLGVWLVFLGCGVAFCALVLVVIYRVVCCTGADHLCF